MNISKALKIKNRLVNELSKLQEVARRENSRRNDNPSAVNVAEIFLAIDQTRSRLVTLKAGIVKASAPISLELAKLAETKAFLNWLPALPVREGEEKVPMGHTHETVTYKWDALYNRQAVDKWIAHLQNEANDLQDAIDDFNAKTQVDWED